jgi:hypothetical protein
VSLLGFDFWSRESSTTRPASSVCREKASHCRGSTVKGHSNRPLGGAPTAAVFRNDITVLCQTVSATAVRSGLVELNTQPPPPARALRAKMPGPESNLFLPIYIAVETDSSLRSVLSSSGVVSQGAGSTTPTQRSLTPLTHHEPCSKHPTNFCRQSSTASQGQGQGQKLHSV